MFTANIVKFQMSHIEKKFHVNSYFLMKVISCHVCLSTLYKTDLWMNEYINIYI